MKNLEEYNADEMREMRCILVPACERCPNIDNAFIDSCCSTNTILSNKACVHESCQELTFADVLKIYLDKSVSIAPRWKSE